jgi:hypothetical protein
MARININQELNENFGHFGPLIWTILSKMRAGVNGSVRYVDYIDTIVDFDTTAT